MRPLSRLPARMRALLWSTLVASAFAVSTAAAQNPLKVLRYSFNFAETGFDPAQISDQNSRIVTANIFDSPLTYDYLARPAKLVLNVAAAMPEVSADARTFTVRLKPGIYFADDPAFKGKRRELVAEDFVYSFKRHCDPRWKSPSFYIFDKAKIVGMEALREQARKTGKFDYDRPVEGLRALDRYTFQVKLGVSNPRFIYMFADPSIYGAVAREVVEHYGDTTMERPVGTGAFRLAEWRRSSRIVLERNPSFREEFYEAQPAADDARGQAIAAQFAGRRLPIIDRVEISIIDESQPRWLAFLAAEHDLLWRLPSDFATLAVPNGQLAPNLQRRGVQLERTPEPSVVITYFNMEDPVIGGNAPVRVALRRAIALAYDTNAEIRLARRGQAIPAQGPMVPMTFGYDAHFKTDANAHDLARAKALLDLFGYLDRDGDGWREQPNGAPLVIDYYSQPDNLSRQYDELWKRTMDSLGLQLRINLGQWPEQLKQARAGKLMMWGLGNAASEPDSDDFLSFGYGPDKGEGNFARFEHPAYDMLYERQHVMPDGPERLATMQQAVKYLLAYMPYKFHVHPIINDLMHPWLTGFRRHAFKRDFWKYVDIDAAAQARAAR